MANYIVTGVAGFIAARISEMLLAAGHRIIGLDNMNDAYDVRLKDYRLARLYKSCGKDDSRFTFFPLDIAHRSTLDQLCEAYLGDTSSKEQKSDEYHFDAVINLAARAGVRTSVTNPWVYVDTNMTGTLNMLELCRRLKIPKFILASTSSIYGEDAPLPTPEEFDSSHPLQPYAASKKGAEVMCHSYHHLYGIDITIFRYFTVYGPSGRPDMSMFRFTQWISEGKPVWVNGDGTQSRGFTYVDDIAQGTIMGLQKLGYEIINLGGHETFTINELIGLLEDSIGKKAQIKYIERHSADMMSSWANVEKAKRILSWSPKVSMIEGVHRLVDWYHTERPWANEILTDVAVS